MEISPSFTSSIQSTFDITRSRNQFPEARAINGATNVIEAARQHKHGRRKRSTAHSAGQRSHLDILPNEGEHIDVMLIRLAKTDHHSFSNHPACITHQLTLTILASCSCSHVPTIHYSSTIPKLERMPKSSRVRSMAARLRDSHITRSQSSTLRLRSTMVFDISQRTTTHMCVTLEATQIE